MDFKDFHFEATGETAFGVMTALVLGTLDAAGLSELHAEWD
jgi:hypothetical protein